MAGANLAIEKMDKKREKKTKEASRQQDEPPIQEATRPAPANATIVTADTIFHCDTCRKSFESWTEYADHNAPCAIAANIARRTTMPRAEPAKIEKKGEE